MKDRSQSEFLGQVSGPPARRMWISAGTGDLFLVGRFVVRAGLHGFLSLSENASPNFPLTRPPPVFFRKSSSRLLGGGILVDDEGTCFAKSTPVPLPVRVDVLLDPIRDKYYTIYR
jgi:hypothetical protein